MTHMLLVRLDPHLGHLHSAVLADASTRWQRLTQKDEVLLTTGVDEHGLKVAAAGRKGMY